MGGDRYYAEICDRIPEIEAAGIRRQASDFPDETCNCCGR